jgi:hypothetical protein
MAIKANSRWPSAYAQGATDERARIANWLRESAEKIVPEGRAGDATKAMAAGFLVAAEELEK